MKTYGTEIWEPGSAGQTHCQSSKHKALSSQTNAQKGFVDQHRSDPDSLIEGLTILNQFFDGPSEFWGLPKIWKPGNMNSRVLVLSEKNLSETKWSMLELAAAANSAENDNSNVKIQSICFKVISPRKLNANERCGTGLKYIWADWLSRPLSIDPASTLKVVEERKYGIKSKASLGESVPYREPIIHETLCRICSNYSVVYVRCVPGQERLCQVTSILYVIDYEHSHEFDDLKLTTQCDLLEPQIGVFGMSGAGKTRLCKAMCSHYFTRSGGNFNIDPRLISKFMKQEKEQQKYANEFRLGEYCLNVKVLALKDFAALNEFNFADRIICNDDLQKVYGYQSLQTLQVAKVVEALLLSEYVELQKEKTPIVISNCPPFLDEWNKLLLLQALDARQKMKINRCLYAMPNLLYHFRGLFELNIRDDCPTLAPHKLRLRGIQMNELDLCERFCKQCPLTDNMSDTTSALRNSTPLAFLDCPALDEMVAAENILPLQKLNFKRIEMSKWVNVGKLTHMFELAPCEQCSHPHELLSDILSYQYLNCMDMTQYHSITMLYLHDLEVEHMDPILLNLTYFSALGTRWLLNFCTMGSLQEYQLLFKTHTLGSCASDGVLEMEHRLLPLRKPLLKGELDIDLKSENLQKGTKKVAMEQEKRKFSLEQRLKGDVDKRMNLPMAEFHRQDPSRFLRISPIFSNIESNLECFLTLIEKLVQYLELKTWTTKSQRIDLDSFKFTKLNESLNQETLEWHNVQMEQKLIEILTEYTTLLHVATNIVLQIVQVVFHLYVKFTKIYYVFHIENNLITCVLNPYVAKNYVHVNLADLGLWKATYSNHSPITNMGAILYLARELLERKNLICFEMNTSMMPSYHFICDTKLFMRIVSDYEGQSMSLPKNCPLFLVLLTIRWWGVSPIDQLDLFILLDQLKNLKQSTPMACCVDDKSSQYVIIERLQTTIAYSSEQMLQNVIRIHEYEIDRHSLINIWTWESNPMGLAGFKDEIKSWTSLPMDIHEALLNKLAHEDLCQMKLVSKELKEIIESDTYHASRGETCQSEGSLSSLYFFIKHGSWQCAGFDSISQKWRRLPPLTYLPPPDADSFKEYLVAGSDGLFCINISKLPHQERLIVCNPLTRKTIELPPLRVRRNPVLMHLMVNAIKNSYKVIVAGSSSMEGGESSKCTEVFDSLTWEWARTGDIPGPEFCLNEYQTGVCINNILYCIAFVDDGSGKAVSGKGVLAYDVDQGMWMPHWKCLLPSPTQHHINSIAQLLECNGELYLFLECEHGRHVDHCVEKLESLFSNENVVGNWNNIVKESKSGGRGLLVYPEFMCVPHGDTNICIFNTIEHKGVVHDIVHGGKVKEIQPPLVHLGEQFHSLNPLSFTFHPNFMIRPSTCKGEET